MNLQALTGAVRRWCAVVATALALAACSGGGSPSAAGGPTPSTAATASTASAASTPSHLTDVPYAKASPQEVLDLYLPGGHLARPAPLLIWIHGGGWRTGDKSSAAAFPDLSVSPRKPTACRDLVEIQVPDVAALNAKGYAVAAIDYRLTQDPVAALQDAKAAVRFLRADAGRYHLDPNRFAAWGNSSGGYSAIMLALTADRHTVFDDPALGNPGVSSAVQAVVDWYGAAEVDDLPGRHTAAEDPYTYLRTAKRRSLPPFHIAQGSVDCVVPAQQSRNLQHALTAVGTAATLTILPGADHEDPKFMRTEENPTLAFVYRTLGRA